MLYLPLGKLSGQKIVLHPCDVLSRPSVRESGHGQHSRVLERFFLAWLYLSVVVSGPSSHSLTKSCWLCILHFIFPGWHHWLSLAWDAQSLKCGNNIRALPTSLLSNFKIYHLLYEFNNVYVSRVEHAFK